MQRTRGRSEEPRPRSKSQPQQPRRASSRDSSISSTSRDVRCGCQFYQSDSLLPERVNPVGRPSSRTSNIMSTTVPNIGDHEYEPIAAPPPKIVGLQPKITDDSDIAAAPPKRTEPKIRDDRDIAAPSPKIEPKITDDLDLEPEEEFDVIKPQQPKSETSSTSSRERRFLRIPLDDELVVLPGDGEDEDEAMAMEGENGEAKAKQSSMPELQDDRCFTATPTTTESRTDYDVNTSQLDSSGLEDVPLKKESRKKKLQEIADQQVQARGFQQRLRSQAGRIRSKLRNMPKPNIKLPERPKFNFPERPKFHLPERPKFNLPERPKFNFPDKSKFHLPERPKFSMPERPKFNLPQRPKISLPSFGMGKDRNDKPRFSSTRRPLRDRSNVSSASTASSSKKNLFDFDFRSYPRIFDRKSRRADYATSSPKPSRGQTPPPQTPTKKKGRWLQRFTDLKYGEETPVPSASEGQSRVTDEIEAEAFREDMEMVEGVESVGRSESTSAFRDKDYGYAVTMEDADRPPEEEERHRMQASSSSVGEARSSGSSSLRHRAGVLEEIDSDEFFLREKGLSQEDVEVGRYLTSEIREAFRTPASALSQMDNFEYYDDEEDVENLGQQYRSTPDRGPTRPARTLRTRKRSSKSKEPSPAEEEDSSQFFNTFPPTRPKRSRKIQQQEEENGLSKDKAERSYEQEIDIDGPEGAVRKIPSFTLTDEEGNFRKQSVEEDGKFRQQSLEKGKKFRQQSLEEGKKFRQQSLEEEERFRQQSLEEEERFTEQSLEEERFRQQSLEEEERFRQQSLEEEEERFRQQSLEEEEERFRQQSLEQPDIEDQWHTEEHAFAKPEPPMPPKRLRRSRKEPIPDTLCNGHYTKEDWLENLETEIVPTEEVMAMRMEPDYIIPAAPHEDFELPPEPPRRGRRKGSHATSLPDEDRTSRGASSLPSERDHATDDLPVDLSLPEIPGYASVEKPITKPRRKTSRPSVPGRRKRSTNGNIRTYPHFYSLPHRPPPIRPLRNYSTLGPSRPPRRHKALPPLDIDQKSESYIEIEDDILEPTSYMEESHGSARHLQSGDIIERMKGRPLPPPPRPPRKGRESYEVPEDEIEDIPDGEAPLFKDDEMEESELFDATEEKLLGAFSDKIFYAQSGVTSVEDEELEEEFPKEEKEESPLELELEEREASPLELELEEREASPLELEEREASPIFSEKDIKKLLSVPQHIETEEVSVGIQTDPLPEDVCVVTGDEDVSISYATVSTETTGLEPSPPRTFEFGQQTIPEPPPTPPEPKVIEKPIPYYVMPDPDTEIELKASKLQVSELDVERLNVGELQAQKITVSDIDGMSLQVAELTSRSGNLVVSGLELPPGFLQDLYDSLPIPTPPPPLSPVQVPSLPHILPVASAPPPVTVQPSIPSESLSASQADSELTLSPQSSRVSKPPPVPVSSPVVSQSPESDSKASVPTESSTPVQLTIDSSTVKPPSSPTPVVKISYSSTPTVQTPSSPTPVAQTPSLTSAAQISYSPTPAAQTTFSPTPAAQTPFSPTPVAQTPSPTSAAQIPSSPTPAAQTTFSPTPEAQTPFSPTPVAQTPSPTSAAQIPSSPTPAAQTPFSPTPVAQTPSPTSAAQIPSSPTPAAQTSFSPTPVAQTPFTPTPVAQTPSPTSAAQIPSSPTPAAQTSFSPTVAVQPPPVPPLPPFQAAPIPPQHAHSIPIQQSIPLHYPNIVTGIDGLHSYIPEYIPSQVPVSLRIPSRSRSHLAQVQREMESEEEMVSLMHTPSSRRRRHHVSKPVARYSSDEEEEEEYTSYRPPSRRHHSNSRGTEPSIGELSRQLLHACQGVSMRALNQLVQYVTTVREGEDKKRDLQIVLCILLLLVAGLILMGFGSGKTYHTHHWDYQFPPRQP